MNKYSLICNDCGLKINTQVVFAVLRHTKCPRCGGVRVRDETLKAMVSVENMRRVEYAGDELPRKAERIRRLRDDDSIIGTKYLYLPEEYAATWVHGGGPIPVLPASYYLSDTRDGTSTPDEVLVHDSPFDLQSLAPGFQIDSGMYGCTFIGCEVEGVRIPDLFNVSYYHQDGLVLCFSNTLSRSICSRLKKEVCVAIDDMVTLKAIIDDQVGAVSEGGNCAYTEDHQRSPFLKSTEDEWMDEFRLFWPGMTQASFTLPPGIARHCNMEG